MKLESKIRKALASKLRVRITTRRRGLFVVKRPNGYSTEHVGRKQALQALYAEARCLNVMLYEVQAVTRKAAK
jgi:hypothetical protein